MAFVQTESLALVHPSLANFAEAVAEGRGKAQAATLRKTENRTHCKKLLADQLRVCTATFLPSNWNAATSYLVEAGEFIPSDGDVVEGVASVDESAITGEKASGDPESGGDRSAVTGGTRVLSDSIVVKISATRGSTFLSPHDCVGGGRLAPKNAKRDRAQYFTRGYDHHFRFRGRLHSKLCGLRGRAYQACLFWLPCS